MKDKTPPPNYLTRNSSEKSSSSDNVVTNSNEIKKNVFVSPVVVVPSSNANKNVVFNAKISDPKKRDSDNKEIAEFMKKKDEKKKIISNHVVKEAVKENKEVRRNVGSNNNLYNINPTPLINKNIIITEEANPLKELMKKQRAELKNRPKEDVVWIGKEKDNSHNNYTPNKVKKEMKFPNVIIVEKPTSNKEIIDINPNINVNSNINSNKNENPPSNSNNKESEEFYNLNRYLNELAKLDNEEGENENEQETQDESASANGVPNDDQLADAIDSIELEDANNSDKEKDTKNNKKDNENDNNDSENTMIEELRIELENSLGFDLFKKVYKTVEENVNLFLI